MINKRKKGLHGLCLFLLLVGFTAVVGGQKSEAAVSATAETAAVSTSGTKTRWKQLMDKYRDKSSTDRLIFVKYKGNARATLVMYKKTTKKDGSSKWEKILSCAAYTGQNGIDKKREGDRKTPTGTFKIGSGFGIKKNPGTRVPYTRLNSYLFWSGEKDTYNKMVDCRTLNRTWIDGEHLIDYKPQYNYALDIGYNKKCTYKKGSAIFLHVTGSRPYTAGCVAVSEANMKKIMKNVTKKTRICIYPYK